MRFQNTFALSVLAVAINASPVPAPKSVNPLNPGHNLNERGFTGDLFSSILVYASKSLQKEFGYTPICSSDMQDAGLMVGTGQGDAPYKWEFCFNEGENEFTQADADAAKCLVNLHYTQNDKCIDVAGSMCEDGYDGMLQNAYVSYWYGNYQITSDQSISIQAAIDNMVGSKMRTDKASNGAAYYPEVNLVADNGSGVVGISFNYEGENDC